MTGGCGLEEVSGAVPTSLGNQNQNRSWRGCMGNLKQVISREGAHTAGEEERKGRWAVAHRVRFDLAFHSNLFLRYFQC